MEQHQEEKINESELLESVEFVDDRLIEDCQEEIAQGIPRERYFGSVRFFKNMILLAVIIMIAIPTGLSIYSMRNCLIRKCFGMAGRQSLRMRSYILIFMHHSHCRQVCVKMV